jgi:hypothetical protein
MPNWCENTLTVKPENVMEDILTLYVRKDEKSKNNFFDFEKITPISSLDENENWYNECIEKWGTKWCPEIIMCQGGYMSFSTAWTPPIPIVRKLATLYPSAQFTLEYSEPEMELRGVYSAQMKNGQIVENNTSWEKIIKNLSKLSP